MTSGNYMVDSHERMMNEPKPEKKDFRCYITLSVDVLATDIEDAYNAVREAVKNGEGKIMDYDWDIK